MKSGSEPSSPLARLKEIEKSMTCGEPYNICLSQEFKGIENSLSWFRWRLEKLESEIELYPIGRNVKIEGMHEYINSAVVLGLIGKLKRELEDKR